METGAWIDPEDARRISYLVGRAPKEIAGGLVRIVSLIVRAFREDFIDARLSGRPGLQGGRLLKAFVAVTPRPGAAINDIEGKTFFREPWITIHETGGTIVPTRRKMLAIPLEAAKTASGFLRGRFIRTGGEGSAYAGERSLYEVPGLVAFKSRQGNLLLGERPRETTRGRGKVIGPLQAEQLTPLFVLVRKVKIPPRLQYFRTWRSWIKGGRARSIVRDGIARVMKLLARKK